MFILSRVVLKAGRFFHRDLVTSDCIKRFNLYLTMVFQYLESTLHTLIVAYLPTLENQKTEYKVLRGSEATKPEVAKRPRGGGRVWEGGVPLPR